MANAPTQASIVILTGHSGSGKSVALRALEDSGYYCVDNLPAALVTDLVRQLATTPGASRLALVMDLRDPAFCASGAELLQRLRQAGHQVRLVFLAAQEDVVVRRYSQTRRLHPLDDGRGLRAAIVREREALRDVHELADETLDTSTMSPHTLRAHIMAQLARSHPGDAMRVSVMSFGFKHGVPLEADMVLDVRFLPNPYFDAALSPMDGRQAPVAAYVLERPPAQAFLRHAHDFLHFLLPQYAAEGKRYFTLAIGCTGGKHRSVALAEAIVTQLAAAGQAAEVRHRDVALGSNRAAAGGAP